MKKIGCIVLIIILAVLIGGYFFIKSYLNEERLTGITREFLSRTFKRPVAVKRVSLKLGWGVNISIDDIQVPNTKGFEEKNLLEIDNMAMRVSLLPLLSRQVVITRTEITEPRVSIEKRSDGKVNLPPVPVGKVEGKSFTLDLRDVSIRNGIVRFEDRKTEKVWLIQNLNQDIQGQERLISISGNGRFLYREKSFEEPLTVRFEDRLQLDTIARELAIKPSKIFIGKSAIEIEGLIDKKTVKIVAIGSDLDVGGLIHLIPVKDRGGFDLTGNIDTKLTILGDLKKPKMEFTLGGKSLELGSMKTQTIGLLDISLSGNEEQIDIDELAFRRRNSKIKASGNYFLKKGSFQLKGSGKIYGQDLTAVFPGLKGNIDIDFLARGRPKKPHFNADIKVQDGCYGDLSNINGSCNLRPDTARIKRLSFKIGESDLNISGQVANFKKPYANVDLRSKHLNLDKFSSSGKGGSKVGMPKIDAKISFAVDRLIVQENDLRRVRGSATYRNEKFRLEKVDFQAYGGSGAGKGEIKISDRPPYSFEVRARDLDARRLFKRFFGISNVSGKFRTKMKTNGLGFNTDDIRRNLTCDGYISLLNGRFDNFGFTNKLLEWLKITKGGKFNFKDINATLKISKGRVRFDDVLVRTRSAEYLLFGTLGFDGRIDYRIMITFSREISHQLKKLHADWLFYTDSRGRVIVDIFAKGTLNQPRFSLDKKKIQQRIKKKIKGNWEKKKNDILKKLKGLFG